MNYIEFFDKSAVENICTCLTHIPDRVIYIGNNSKLMKKHIENYKKVFSDRGEDIEFLYKTVTKSNLDGAVDLLSEIVETYNDCVFDITGGNEILTLALGVVYSRYQEKNIKIHRFNLVNGTVVDCDKDGETIYKDIPTLSVEENIKIYGGSVIYGNVDEENTYEWDLNPDFLKDISTIWNICKADVGRWNKQISDFAVVKEIGRVSADGLTTTVSRAALDVCPLYTAFHDRVKRVVNELLKCGLLTRFAEDETSLTISFKNKQIKRCLTKAGQALEMKIFVTAKGILDNNGSPIYNDALNGVVIDWDGKLHDESTENCYDTENEIDVLLMHGTVPVFISCKNGLFTADELYKLHTVAERFGGKYSKKVLVATAINSLGRAGGYLRQRAADMGITIIEGIQKIDDRELARRLKGLCGT